jgi:hypothetical protein
MGDSRDPPACQVFPQFSELGEAADTFAYHRFTMETQ